ncbi:armadillo repeat-containing protein gudu-like [Melanaphis sacchari]|uniref:armadillo repeat-containing protein gudu-like n=1 Tax=Melanaphis sacchari TaxID=742174 RepID=UPI000DC13A5B|nr:armadillo repeat-containing protein gudu-like [Melanaphis sacchari]
MADEQVELASKDVFVLLGVSVPENLEIGTKRQEQGDTKDVENESVFTLDEDDKVYFMNVVEPLVVDVTPPDDLDNSSTDSFTQTEIEEQRWYNPTLNTGLEKSDFETLKRLLAEIKNTDPTKTLAALIKLKMEKILEGPYQNMFIALNGFKVLINILECNNEDCMENALIIVHEMSQHYGIQCSLCKLDAVKPLINILLFINNYNVKYLASETLQNIAKLRKGRKLIRLSGGIKIIVQMMNVSKYVLPMHLNNMNETNRATVGLMNCCSGILRQLCRSLKSQEELWETGFVQLLSQLLNSVHSETQISIMSLVAECCRTRPEVVQQKTNINIRVLLKELNILQQIIQFLVSDITQLAEKAAETILCMFDDSLAIYDILLKYRGMETIFKAMQKFQNEDHVMVLVITLLWKSSLHTKCRQVIEKDPIVDFLLGLLTYKFDDRVIGYAVATLSELWKSESLRGKLRRLAVPQYLELLNTSLHSLVLAHVCTALGRASSDPQSMEIIDEAKGFRLIFVLLPSLDVDEFDKYEDFYEPQTIIAVAECLAMIVENTKFNLNPLKGMYEAVCDLVDLLTHKNLDFLAAVCHLIDVIATFEENLKIMVDAGIVEHLSNLVYTEHTNLRANLCKALGKCCKIGVTARRFSCQNIIDELIKYTQSEHTVIRENVPLALSGLSEDPLNCVRIEALGFLPFLKECIHSDNPKTAMAAVNCLSNVRKASAAIGQFQECSKKR